MIFIAKLENHKNSYLIYRKDANSENISIQSRAELYFLSIFQLIEACGAKYRVRINKHQKVRINLENNPSIFGENTELIWRFFQDIENKIRPKFSYGFSWIEKDFNELKEKYEIIEKICLKVLENNG
ncbi:MAG: hypothetical protein EU533_07465 [Promethearchaeota archaeon]|nr:MAG: hypothetical protein EU533_07465 [Candidatus Lokiarchaeota archaeon]